MFKKILCLSAAIAILVTSGALFAQDAGSQKVAVVNIQAAMLSSEYGQAEMAKLEKSADYSALITEFEGLRADLQALDSEASANSSKWDAERIAEYQKQRQFLQADLELNGRKIQTDQQAAVQSIYAAMNQPAQEALQELIAEESVTLLLKAEAVYHATVEHDLTQKLALKLGK